MTLWQFSYDAQGRLKRIIDADQRGVEIEPDAEGRPVAIRTEDGRRTTLLLDDAGNVLWRETGAFTAEKGAALAAALAKP